VPQPDDLKYVLATCKSWWSRKCTAPAATACWSARRPRKAEIEDFRKAVLANPAGYIAQPTLSLSTCPTFVESGIAPRHIDLRPFVLSGKPRADGARRPDARGAEGGLAGGQLVAGRRHQGHLGAGSEGGGNMLSRTADHLFWMSRYTERAENTARMLDVNYQTSLLPQSAAVAEAGLAGPAVHQRAAAGLHRAARRVTRAA
jgi:hypothetical protein